VVASSLFLREVREGRVLHQVVPISWIGHGIAQWRLVPLGGSVRLVRSLIKGIPLVANSPIKIVTYFSHSLSFFDSVESLFEA